MQLPLDKLSLLPERDRRRERRIVSSDVALSTKTFATAPIAVADRKIGDDSSAADRGKNPFSYLKKKKKVKLLPKREKNTFT